MSSKFKKGPQSIWTTLQKCQTVWFQKTNYPPFIVSFVDKNLYLLEKINIEMKDMSWKYLEKFIVIYLCSKVSIYGNTIEHNSNSNHGRDG